MAAISNNFFLEKLLDGAEVVWRPLGEIAEYSRERISHAGLNEDNYVGVDNLLQNRAGKTKSSCPPTSGNHIVYQKGDVLIGNIRPYVKKIWHADQDGGTNGDVLVVHITGSHIDSRYLYQVLSDDKFFNYNTQHAKGAKMPRGNKTKILEYSIPIPCPDNPEKSLAIQAEIVRILDTFAELTTVLTAELAAELTARQKQYNYYRDHLFTFNEDAVEWKPLGEIGEFIRGKRFTKADYVNSDGIDVIHYGEIYTHYGVTAHSALSQVRNELAPSLRFAEPGDVVMAGVGEIIGEVGKAVAWLGHDRVAIHDDSYAFRHSIDPKYLSHYMQTSRFIAEKRPHVSYAKVKRLLINGVSKVRVPIPHPQDARRSLAEQARIAEALDNFDALTNSITEGLPREIELRQKQYAYYRDLLLSFPKPEVVL